MNPQQQTFVNEMLRHGDKLAAYRTAYPGTKSGKTIESSVNRLLKHAEVKQAIDEPTNRIRAEAEAELKQRLQAELIDIYEAQKTLSQIIRGTHTTQRQVHIKGGFETIDVKPTIGQVLTALNTWFRLNGYIGQVPASKKVGQKIQPGEDTTTYVSEAETALGEKFPLQSPEYIREAEGGSPHPFGNIYPASYPGPYYDPDDPNTKEKLQNLRFDRLTDCPAETKESTPPFEGGVARRAGVVDTQHGHKNTTTHNKLPCQPTPTPVIASHSEAISRKQEEALITRDCFVAKPPRNDGIKLQNTTIHNNICPPELRSNLAVCKNWKILSPIAQQTLLRDALRKQGWQTIEDAFNEVSDIYLRNQHRGTYNMLKLFEKARDARNLPPGEREAVEKETGWARHPQYPFMMKRTRALGW